MGTLATPHDLVATLFAQLQEDHPDWIEMYDQTDFSHTCREEVDDLLRSAPNGFAAGLVYGKLTILQELAMTQPQAQSHQPTQISYTQISYTLNCMQKQSQPGFLGSDFAQIAA